MTPKPTTAKTPSRKAIVRAVTSSTAIETGKKVDQLESLLRRRPAKFRTLKLAD